MLHQIVKAPSCRSKILENRSRGVLKNDKRADTGLNNPTTAKTKVVLAQEQLNWLNQTHVRGL